MQKKTIKKVLNKKLKEWVSTIDDEQVASAVNKNTIITGGAIASMLMGEEVKDFDVYFRNKETVLLVAKYYISKFKNKNYITNIKVEDESPDNPLVGRVKIVIKSKGVASEDESILDTSFEDYYDAVSSADELEDSVMESGGDKYRPIFFSSNAITLSNKIQCVLRFYGEPKDIHSTYDFIHATNYWTSWENEVVCSVAALESLMSRQLVYTGSKYPICSVIRTRKFVNRGWRINAGQFLKMAWQISNLDLTNLDVLEDQLIGVDSAYFNDFIKRLKTKQESDPTWKLEESYLYTVIDKIF